MKRFICFFIIVWVQFSAFAQKPVPSLSDISNFRFYPEIPDNINHLPDGSGFTFLEDNKIIKCSYDNPSQRAELLNFSDYFNIKVSGYQISPDSKKVLVYCGRQPIHRYSFYTYYYVVNIAERTVKPIYTGALQQLATFSPASDCVAFIVDNNIMLYNLNTDSVKPVTTDGKINSVLNGLPDWVYEEEFEFNRAFEFSPDGKKIAYIRFDESAVKQYSLQYYKSPTDSDTASLYPQSDYYKYPVAGQNNSIISVHITDINSGISKTVDLGSEQDIYVPSIMWMNADNLCVSRMNRLQNTLDLLDFNCQTNKTASFFKLQEKKYIEESVSKSIIFDKKGESFFIVSEKDNNRNIYHYSAKGTLIAQVTKGYPEVISLLAADEKNIYFTSVGSNSYSVTFCKVDINGKNRKNLTPLTGTSEPDLSANLKYFVNTYSNSLTPPITAVYDISGKQISVLEDNKELLSQVGSYKGVTKEFFSVKTSEKIELNAFIIKPEDFDSTKKYPVLVVGYNGPDYNMVNDDWDFNWNEYLAQNGCLVACVDTRGTGRKGTEFRKTTYGNLGFFETKDLLEFASYLKKQSYVDGSKLGIWGWSYGGFMAANVMTRGNGVYALGISVAPVTDWRYYDNIYTERYMGLPEDNLAGYRDNSPLTYAADLQGKFLLICGSADDNVHPDNSLALSEALVQANKQFDYMVYTNRNHGIYGGNTRLHLYTKMTNFIFDSFGIQTK